MSVPKIYEPSKAMHTSVGDEAAVKSNLAKLSGKAKQRFPHTPLGPNQTNGQAGKMKTRAYTPGGPSGS